MKRHAACHILGTHTSNFMTQILDGLADGAVVKESTQFILLFCI